jgi:hypothetical protein
MIGTWISVAIEALVAFLLAVTIGYCMLLNHRLKKLKADEMGLRKTITELVLATEIAERAINGLKHAAVECDKTLAKRVREAEYFSIEIAREVGEGNAVLERISQITRVARGDRAGSAAIARNEVTMPIPAPSAPVMAAPVMADTSRADDLRMKAQQTAERLANLRRGTAEKAA